MCDSNLTGSEVIFGECQSVYFSFATSDLSWEDCVPVAPVMSRVNKMAEERSDFIDSMVTFWEDSSSSNFTNWRKQSWCCWSGDIFLIGGGGGAENRKQWHKLLFY